MQDFVTNTINLPGGTVTLTLEGLTPGTQYQTRLFSRRLDHDPRLATLSFDIHGDGPAEHTITLDQNDPTQEPANLSDRDQPYAIEYEFRAESDRLVITVQQPEANRPWTFYGLTNEVREQNTVAPIETVTSTGLDEEGIPLPPGSLDPNWIVKETGSRSW